MEDTIIKALLLGYAHIECNGTPIRICLKKAQGLLFYLLVHKKATRDELTGLLWGGEDNELARRHLRDNLYHLKKVVPIELVVPAGRSAIQLNPELGFYIDVDEFLKAVDVEAYQGEFLKGFSVPNCYEYEEWLERTRTSLREAYLQQLDKRAEFCLSEGKDGEAEALWRKYLQEEPLCETVSISLMRFYRAQKDYNRAALIYRGLHKATLPFSSQLADAVREAVRDYHEGSMYKRDEAVRTFRRNLFPRWKPGLGNVLACCDIFQIILEAAYEKYVSAANQNNQNYQEIARLGYVSKAYLVLAAIGTSGGALNLLAQMLINQANQYEADQRISFFRRHPDIDTFVQQHAAPYGWPLNDNYALAYRVLQSVCGIQRGSQPYSHMKKAELVLKGYVSESSSTQLTSLNIAINGGLAMGHYWKGRLLLEQAKQDHDRCNDYKDAAIASFCATNVTERFDHLPENADEDAAPQLSPPQWLSAIELLRYPDRAVFRVDRRMVFQTIYQKLTQQVEEVQSDNIQIHNERYRLTKKDVRSNLERCLDMVKAQFPDKEPLIQKMIRSIR